MTDTARSCLAIVLAAGEGTRMRSAKPKVLHEVAGRSMVGHVLAALQGAGGTACAVVVGPERQDVAAEARRQFPSASIHEQRERLGTAHAVLAARDAFAPGFDDVLIAFGDTPLISAATFQRLRTAIAGGAAVAVLGFEAADPTGYGRLVMEQGGLSRIVEERDASAAERAVRLCNGGLMALDGRQALAMLEAIDNSNAKGEYYLTDCVGIARAKGLKVAVEIADEDEVRGVNDRIQLAEVEALMQDRLRRAVMASGVTMQAPETVFLSYDTVIGRDCVIEPNVVFAPGVRIGNDVTIHAFCHFDGLEKGKIKPVEIGEGCEIGPYARIRPGTIMGPKVKIGNFVETKNARLAEGVKANHLTYLGDTQVGRDSNIGAGTITCNYDGFLKHETVIGANVFVGTNTSIVAPANIGDGAMIAAGTTIGGDVPGDALAIVRAERVVKAGAARAFRAHRTALKAQQGKGDH